MSSIQKELPLTLPIFKEKKKTNPEKYGLKLVLFQMFIRSEKYAEKK